MAGEREITITVRGTNLTNEGFEEARQKLLGLEDTTRRVKPPIDQTKDSWRELTVGFLSATLIDRGASALLSFGRQALEVTGHLTDLAGKSGIGVEALQRLNYVTSQSGVGLDQIAAGAVKLGKNLVEGDKSTVAAVQALNLNVDQLIAAGPEQAFLKIGQAIATVPNPMEQAALATALFGKSGADYLPAFTTDMEQLAQQAQDSGAVLEADLVAAGDSAGDAFGRLGLVMQAMTARILLPMMPAIEGVANWLGMALPAALTAARTGVDWLIRQGLQLNLWLADTALAISRTVSDVPVLGRVFGAVAGNTQELEQRVQLARDTLSSFNAQGVRPTGESARAAAPLVTGFGDAVQTAGQKGRKAAEDLGLITGELDNITRFQIAGILNPQLESFETHTDNAAEAMDELTAAMARAEGQAIQIGPVLENTMRLPWVAARTSAVEVEPEIDGWFGRIFGGADTLGAGISGIFQAAFVGGGGALGAVKSFATQTLAAMLEMIPGIGPWVSAFAGPIVEMFGRLTRKATEFFRTLFGGPGQGELNDRNMVREWEDQVIASSTNAQNETERWRAVVVATTEAYLRAGLSAADAERDVARLWASSREGGEETWRVVAEINEKIAGAGQVAADSVNRIGRAIDDLPDVVDIEIRGNYRAPDLDGARYAGGTKGVHGTWFPSFSPGQWVQVDPQEAIVPRSQIHDFVRDVAGSLPGTSMAAPTVYIVNDLDGARQVPEEEYRAVVQRLMSTGRIQVPARAVVTR